MFIEAITEVGFGTRDTQGDLQEPLWTKFFQLFSPWEREELLSIQEFLVTYVRDLQMELQDYIVEQLSRLADENIARLKRLQLPIKIADKRTVTWYLDNNCTCVIGTFRHTMAIVHYIVMRVYRSSDGFLACL